MDFEVCDNRLRLKAQISMLGQDILVTVTGGKNHIGSISSAMPDKDGDIKVSTITYPGHKDDVISERFSRELCAKWGRKTVVICGIHYDNASRELINHIVEKSDELLEKICASNVENI